MSLFSPALDVLEPYVPGEQCNDADWIKLNTNESPLGPPARVLEVLAADVGESLRLYPDPQALALKQAIARSLALTPEQVFVGNGSDEVLAHAFQAFFRQAEPLCLPDITYNFYRSYCALFGIKQRMIPLTADLRIEVSDYRGPCGGIVFANPNAPTGRLLGLDAIAWLAQQHPNAMVLVDEAYIDFGGESAIPLIREHENVLVVQTFSKSRSLAGLRIGFAIGRAETIAALERVKNSFNSYPLGRLAITGGVAAIEDEQHLSRVRRQTVENRERLSAELAALDFEVIPSHANFVFARHAARSGKDLAASLRTRKILVRRFEQPRIDDFLRITIGTSAQCDALVRALEALLHRDA